MRKLDWYAYLKLPKTSKESFVGVLVNKDNIATCYEAGEEKKYKAALKRKEKELV